MNPLSPTFLVSETVNGAIILCVTTLKILGSSQILLHLNLPQLS